MRALLRRLLDGAAGWFRGPRAPSFEQCLARAEEELAPTLLRVRSLERALSGQAGPRRFDPRAEGAAPGSLRAAPGGAGESTRTRFRG